MTRPIGSRAAVVLLTASLFHLHAPAAAQRGATSARLANTSGTALTAHVYPRVSRAPAIVRVLVRVEPAAGNRALQIVIDSDTYYRSSTIELSGEDAPRLHTMEFRHVPVGVHDVDVSLLGATGSVRAVVHDRVLILD
jgi:hypothetical protein